MATPHGSVLPKGWPSHVHGPLVWSGSDFADPEEYLYRFTEEDIGHIDAAIAYFQGLGVAKGFASPETFPLPESFSQRLKAVADTVYGGRGFQVLRGLNPAKYTEHEVIVLYAGLTSHVANRRARNIDHIRDRSHDNPDGDSLRPLELSVSMGFHTDIDVYDMLTMFTQTMPEKGGEQHLVSVAAMYNILAENNPDILRLLSEDWYWERMNRPEIGVEELLKFHRPLLAYENGQVQINYAGTFVGGNPEYPLSAEAPELPNEKKRALKTLQDTAWQCQVQIDPEPGDLLFVNNYALMHARGSWQDSREDPQKQRYMMRLWLHDESKGWKSATALQRKLDTNFDLPPEKQGLRTFTEWQKLPRSHRVKTMGTSERDCHD